MDVGDVMSEAKVRALKAVAITAGLLVYAGFIVYSGVHNFTLMTAGVPPDLLIWAIVGVIGLEITAAALPLALHFWCHAPLQRIAAFIFYFVDLAIILMNVILNFALTQGNAIPEWGQLWLFYGVPATPVIAGFGWTMLFLLDPSSRQREIMEQLKASTMETLGNRIVVAASQTDITSIVEAAAERVAYDVVSKSLGAPAKKPARELPAQIENAGSVGSPGKAGMHDEEDEELNPTAPPRGKSPRR